MIRNIFNLTKIFLISSLFKGSKQKRKLASYILYGFLYLYLGGVLAFLSFQMLDTLIALHQENAFVGYVLMAIITLILLTAIISCINVYYFSRDNASILALPLTPFEILSSKLNTMLVYEYIEELLIGAIPLTIFGIRTQQGLLYYPILLIVLLCIPVLPLIIISLIIMILMAFLKGMRNKNAVQMITMMVSIFFSLFISMSSSGISSQADALTLMEQANGFAQLYKKAFPTMPMAMSALLDHNLLALLGLVLVSAASYLLLAKFGQKLFFDGVLASLASSSGVSDKKVDAKKAFHSRGLAFSYMMKECKVYLRNPTFFTQVILPPLILPAFIMLIMYLSFTSSGSDMISMLSFIYADESFAPYVFGVVGLVLMFGSIYSFIPLLAISKDRHDAYFMKYIPVPYYRQLIYKTIPDLAASMFTYVVNFLFMAFLFRIPLSYLTIIFPLYIGYSILRCFLILFDSAKPKLTWTSEIQIAKNNLRTLWGMAYSTLNMAIFALLCFLLKLSPLLTTVLMSLVYLCLIAFLYSYIKKKDIALADGFE